MIKLQVIDDVAQVELDRPPVNAWTDDCVEEFERVIDAIERDEGLKAAVVRGANSVFSAGADVRMMEAAMRSGDVSHLDAFAAHIQSAFTRWAALQIPTLAVLEGAAVGAGFELALACDLRIVTPEARLGLPEVLLGLVPAGGGTQRLTSIAGRGTALWMILTGELVSGTNAERLGIVQWCADASSLPSRVTDIINTLCRTAGPSHAAIKRCIALADTPEGYAAETASQEELHRSLVVRSRIEAFLAVRGKQR